MSGLLGLLLAALLGPSRIGVPDGRRPAEQMPAALDRGKVLDRQSEHADTVLVLVPRYGKAPAATVAVERTSCLRRARISDVAQSMVVAVGPAGRVCTLYAGPETPAAVPSADCAYMTALLLARLVAGPSAHSCYVVLAVLAEAAAEPSADYCRAAAVAAPSTIVAHALARGSHRMCLIVDGKALEADLSSGQYRASLRVFSKL